MRPLMYVSIHFVCGEMQHSRNIFTFCPIFSYKLQYVMYSVDIGMNEVITPYDGVSNVSFSCHVNYVITFI